MSKLIDLTGQKFGRLTVIERAGSDKYKNAMWLCKCDCEKQAKCVVNGSYLRKGLSQSCGCYNRELNSERMKTHGESKTRLYKLWVGMKKRCYNQNCNSYKYYGAEGKAVCDEWKDSFQAFYDWSMSNGYQDNLTIERIDNSKGYSPDNCKWATMKEQSNNTRRNHLIEYKGKKQNLTQWAEELNINYDKLEARINRLHWDVDRAFKEPKKMKSKRSSNYLIPYNGETHTLAEWSKIVGIKYWTLVARIYSCNWDIDRALSTPVRRKNNAKTSGWFR